MSNIASVEQAYKDDVAKWRKKRQDFENATQSEKAHTSSSWKTLAALSRGGPYRANGYFYIRANGARRGIYDKSPSDLGKNLIVAKKRAQGGLAAGSVAHGALYVYVKSRVNASGVWFNFLAAFMPYKNEAHHLVPIEAVDSALEDKLALFKKLPYNINHGENIIFLPKNTKDVDIHKLPQHNGSHPKYNALVMGDLKKLRGQLTSKARKECEPEDPPPIGVLDKVIKLESDYWKLLVGTGAMSVNVRAATELAKRAAAASGV